MSSPAARDRSRRARTQQIENFARTYDLSVNPLNNGYQLRVENLVDLYPVNGRYCILQTGERGDFDTDNDLRQLMLRAIPDHMPHLVQRAYNAVHDDHVDSLAYAMKVLTQPPVLQLYIVRNRLSKWFSIKVLHRPTDHVFTRKEMRGKFDLSIDIDRSLPNE